jgi:Bacterial transcriptional regulator
LGATELKAVTSKTITSPALVKAQLRRIVEHGYARDDQKVRDGACGVAAPVRDYSAEVVAAISITGPACRITLSKLPEIAEKVIEAADNISWRLRYRPKAKATATKSRDKVGRRPLARASRISARIYRDEGTRPHRTG